jgi:proton-translocating NADH-quinone oxidoreductase, chain M
VFELKELGAPVLWATIAVPTLLAIASQVLGFRSRQSVRLLAYLSALTLLIPVPLVVYYLGYKRVGALVDPLILDLSAYNIGFIGLVLDGLSAPIVVGISIVTALVSIYSVKYMEHRIDELHGEEVRVPGLNAYFILYNAFSSSMLGMAYSSNLIGFFIFLELSLITSFLLIAFYGYGDRLRIALMYFIWTHIGGALFLAGTLYYGVNAGSFDVLLVETMEYNRVLASVDIGGLATLAPLFIVVGLLVKMAVFGVHMWLPYAHAEAPTPISALLSPNLIGIAGYALARFSPTMFPQFIADIRDLLVFLAFVTIVYGGFVALRENDFKRFLAYSSISQMGYILLGVATLTGFGVAGAMLHYLSHAIGKAVLFMVSGVFITEMGGLRNMLLMGGLARVYPTTAAITLIGFMHLVGMPPSLGMWSEILIVLGLIGGYNPGAPSSLAVIALLVIVAFMVTATYSFIAMRRIFFGPLRQGRASKGGEVMDEFKIAILIIAVSGIIAFLVVELLIEPLRASVNPLLELVGGG